MIPFTNASLALPRNEKIKFTFETLKRKPIRKARDTEAGYHKLIKDIESLDDGVLYYEDPPVSKEVGTEALIP